MSLTPIDPFNYTPQLRVVPSNLLTRGGWMRGQFRLPPHQALVDFLGGGQSVVKFTKVYVPGDPEEFAFVGVRRDSLALVEPTLGDDELIEVAGAGHITTTRTVTCIMEIGHLTGDLEVLVHVRVSDFLRQAPEFLVMRNCHFVPHGEDVGSVHSRRLPVALVNLQRVIGVAERNGSGNAA